jgi:molecular chaperone DnaK (HSP70)
MSDARFVVGIDLGTSNCAISYAEPRHGRDAPVVDFPIAQLRRAGEVSASNLLPSSLYLPGTSELSPEALRLPWGEQLDVVVGEFARWQGARVPGRLVTSAKSWLCHPGVDRSAPILPWGSTAELKKLSPVEASSLLLGHMAAAWNFAHSKFPLAQQEVIITVPASFDEVARSLTVSAAKQAGLDKFTLVEEPQAAFYDFTAHHRRDLERVLAGIRIVLVVDVGGGTSDFTLVQTAASQEGPLLRRLAVGDHLMLGGDNMDAALSRRVESQLTAGDRKLSAAQWMQLTHVSREAKEMLLGEKGPEFYNLSILAEGSRLIGQALSARVSRVEAEQVILDGFFPACKPDQAPQRSSRVALQELGLPYAQDPAITHHLADFLRRHAVAAFAALGEQPGVPGLDGTSRLPRPDAILLNGGVFNSPKIAERLVNVVSSWWPESGPIPLLGHRSLELAVARGAAFYGLVKRGLGRRISGGSARAFYVGLEKTGSESPLALCVIPRGQEEGLSVTLSNRVFNLATGRPVRFPLYSTASDRLENSGDVVPVTEDIQPLPPIHTLLKGVAGRSGEVPVHLVATLTEIGTLEIWCVSNQTDERWKLEFEVRGGAAESAVTVTEPVPAAFAGARQWIERIYGSKPLAALPAPAIRGTPPKDVKQLWNSLESILGPRDQWRLPVLRELWATLLACAGKRRRSAEHERIFFQLFGFTLRPGFGYPLDEWRCEQSARLFAEGVQFHQEKIVWNEFWVLWRRIAGGLTEARHEEIWDFLKPHLALRLPAHAPKNLVRPKGVQPEGVEEMVRLAAALEHLSAASKAELGAWIAARLRAKANASGPWTWALGRLGARTPLYGSIHKTLPRETATEWVRLLLEPKMVELEGALFALAQLARLTGDRARDLEEAVRVEVLNVVRKRDAAPTWEKMVAEVIVLGAADKARALGDTLPVGLSLA